MTALPPCVRHIRNHCRCIVRIERFEKGRLMAFTVLHVSLTDGAGEAYAVDLKKEPRTWEDQSPAGREISNITQGDSVTSTANGLACSDGQGGTTLLLRGASWNAKQGDSGGADRQHDPGGPVDADWNWEVSKIDS